MDKLEADAGVQGTFLDELVMHEVLSEIRDIAQRDAQHPHRHAVLLEGLKTPGPCPAHRAQVQRQKDDVAARLL